MELFFFSTKSGSSTVNCKFKNFANKGLLLLLLIIIIIIIIYLSNKE